MLWIASAYNCADEGARSRRLKPRVARTSIASRGLGELGGTLSLSDIYVTRSDLLAAFALTCCLEATRRCQPLAGKLVGEPCRWIRWLEVDRTKLLRPKPSRHWFISFR